MTSITKTFLIEADRQNSLEAQAYGLNTNTTKENKFKLWKSMTKKNHMLHLELFREIQNG